jgi:hypothetical protein
MAWNTPYYDELPDSPDYVGVITGFETVFIGQEQKLKFNIKGSITEGVYIDAPFEIGFLPETGMGEGIIKGIIRKVLAFETPGRVIGPMDHLEAGQTLQSSLQWIQQKLYGAVVVFEQKTSGKYKNQFLHEIKSLGAPAQPAYTQTHPAMAEPAQPFQAPPMGVNYAQGSHVPPVQMI